MLLRQYGTKISSVDPNFDPHALTDVAFVRTNDFSMSTEEFESAYERVDGREITAEVAGDVKVEVKRGMLEEILEQLRDVERSAGEEHVVLVENDRRKDHPKTRDETTTKVIAGQNRLHFVYTIDPPIRVGVYRRKGG